MTAQKSAGGLWKWSQWLQWDMGMPNRQDHNLRDVKPFRAPNNNKVGLRFTDRKDDEFIIPAENSVNVVIAEPKLMPFEEAVLDVKPAVKVEVVEEEEDNSEFWG